MPLSSDRVEQERVRFEDWYNVTHGFYKFYLKECGKYKAQEVQIAFDAWLAAIEAQEITLPRPKQIHHACGYTDAMYYAKDILDCLATQDYKVVMK